MSLLPKDFYLRENVVELSKELLGKYLWTHTDNNGITAGKIVETEAYAGEIDKASHAYGGRFTERTKIMYHHGGVSYVYLCYGIHHLFNVITGSENIPHAVLIRAIEPVEGIKIMMNRRKKEHLTPALTSGPGSLTQALGITRQHNGLFLWENTIWLTDEGVTIDENNIIASPRVGIDYAGEHAKLPWRFRIKNNKWVSPAK